MSEPEQKDYDVEAEEAEGAIRKLVDAAKSAVNEVKEAGLAMTLSDAIDAGETVAAKLKARLVAMAAEQDIAIVAVDPAYTSMWGAQHWQKPLTNKKRKTTRHDAAADP